jgi:hypothetical protein
MILAFPVETPQQRADALLRLWQEQRRAGIKPDQRSLPDDDYHRDLEIIRECMDRK